MLNLGIIVNVVVGILVYKSVIALVEFFCLKLVSTFLSKKITGRTRKERIDRAIKIAEEELKRTELN